MLAVKKEVVEVCYREQKPADKRIFEAKPMRVQPDYEAMRERAMKRFSKTIAYLAK